MVDLFENGAYGLFQRDFSCFLKKKIIRSSVSLQFEVHLLGSKPLGTHLDLLLSGYA